MAKIGRPKSEAAKRKSLTIRLSDDTYAKLLQYASEHNVTLTEVALRGLKEYLSKPK